MRPYPVCLSLASAALVIGLASGCGADPVTVPDLVGQPLDEAHRTLEGLGFKEFDDQDAFEDRAIVRDANWVVIGSDPAPGDPASPDDTVTFTVGKRDEQRAIDELPSDSPVAREHATALAKAAEQQTAAAERKRAQDAADDRRAAELATGYVNELDPLIRVGNNVITELDATARGVRQGTYGPGQGAWCSRRSRLSTRCTRSWPVTSRRRGVDGPGPMRRW